MMRNQSTHRLPKTGIRRRYEPGSGTVPEGAPSPLRNLTPINASRKPLIVSPMRPADEGGGFCEGRSISPIVVVDLVVVLVTGTLGRYHRVAAVKSKHAAMSQSKTFISLGHVSAQCSVQCCVRRRTGGCCRYHVINLAIREHGRNILFGRRMRKCCQ